MDELITNWESCSMDWGNPNPQEVKYWQAIALAITERVSLLRQCNIINYDFQFRGIELNKVSIDSPKIKQIINTFSNAILNLIHYFVQVTENKDNYGLIYINDLKPERIASECEFFYFEPQTTTENEKLKDFLIACKSVLDKLYLVAGDRGNLGLFYKSKATFDKIEEKENLSDIINYLDNPENLKSEYTESRLESFSFEIEYSKYYESFSANEQTIPQKIYFKNPTCFPCQFFVFLGKDGYENWKEGFTDFGLNWQENSWTKIVNSSEKTGEKLIAENLKFSSAFSDSDFDKNYGGNVEKGFDFVCYADFTAGLHFIEK